ncbi:hypothetical protein D3C72_718310 [compost metagenome]
MAPQAIVMKTNGNRLPATTGPVPSMKRVKAGSCSIGAEMAMPTAIATTVPTLTKVLR